MVSLALMIGLSVPQVAFNIDDIVLSPLLSHMHAKTVSLFHHKYSHRFYAFLVLL